MDLTSQTVNRYHVIPGKSHVRVCVVEPAVSQMRKLRKLHDDDVREVCRRHAWPSI